jgi:hypothetical protein
MKPFSLVAPVVALACALAVPIVAEETATSSADANTAQVQHVAPLELVRLQVVLARLQDGKKTLSAPYTLLVATDGKKVQLRMGVEVPIAVGIGNNSTSFQYKNVGMNIDCSVQASSRDLYQVDLRVENSSIYPSDSAIRLRRKEANEDPPGQDPFIVQDRPMFRSFAVSLSPLLRDGQALQATASTDPVTGEVVKIDLTLNVIK